ncbi:hypothetical protein CEE37_06705 [candidate division LCP-89 bacterium B3_LCP]|uniref:Smf/DprA SLOG domain-containing protein n=1 Tax=candidate division LCP-89 bacterium B3_LCP TaxID=2012998 RepID=A0A532V0E9_UNCL8|nr:MAG: hypothetical protein CEE37_06705 [candidate division LCP-89 bacterium B3_LCP]
MTEEAHLLHLLRLPLVGPVSLRLILTKLTNIGVPLQRMYELSDDQLLFDLQLTPEQVQAFRNPRSNAEEDLQQCSELDIEFLLSSDSRYPWKILKLLGHTAPHLLFAIGNLELLQMPSLGVSGSRNASEDSLSNIAKLCEMVSSQGWVIVSGGARGVDEVAHLTAIRHGPGTIVVLPTGVLKPRLRKELVKHFEEGKGLLLSEFLPEQGWTQGCAMQRNRILAALSNGVVLVEPGPSGGTGGTGKIALKLRIPLYVLKSSMELNQAAQKIIDKGASQISPDGIKPKALITTLQCNWEESEKQRIARKTEELFSS